MAGTPCQPLVSPVPFLNPVQLETQLLGLHDSGMPSFPVLLEMISYI